MLLLEVFDGWVQNYFNECFLINTSGYLVKSFNKQRPVVFDQYFPCQSAQVSCNSQGTNVFMCWHDFQMNILIDYSRLGREYSSKRGDLI